MNELELIEVYCKTWNTLNTSLIEAYLADDVVLDSQDVLTPLVGKSAVYDYHVKKVEAIRKTVWEYDVYAEVGYCGSQAGNTVQVLSAYEFRPCGVMAQGGPQNLVGLVLLDVENDQIKRIGYCTVVPHFSAATRTGIYPHVNFCKTCKFRELCDRT